jgi:hypothetical protein
MARDIETASRRDTHPELHVAGFVGFHASSSIHGIGAVDHLDKGMALIDVDNACLNNSKLAEE